MKGDDALAIGDIPAAAAKAKIAIIDVFCDRFAYH
jgi:hypothetical protein